MNDRDNYRNFAELQDACDKARLTLRRKRATIDDVRDAAFALNKAVRTLRSWNGTLRDELKFARQIGASRLKEIRRLDEIALSDRGASRVVVQERETREPAETPAQTESKTNAN
jgi:hypothetical protein